MSLPGTKIQLFVYSITFLEEKCVFLFRNRNWNTHTQTAISHNRKTIESNFRFPTQKKNRTFSRPRMLPSIVGQYQQIFFSKKYFSGFFRKIFVIIVNRYLAVFWWYFLRRRDKPNQPTIKCNGEGGGLKQISLLFLF